MKFSVKPDVFNEAISEAVKGAASKSTFPVLQGLLIASDGREVTLTGTDLEVCVQRSFEPEVAEPGKAVLPAKLLQAMVGRLKGNEPVTLAWDDAKSIGTLTHGRHRSRLHGYPPVQYPTIPEAQGEPVLTLPAQRWRDILNRAVIAAADDDKSRPYLNGVHLALLPAEGRSVLTATATDSARIAHIRQDGPAASRPYEVIIPQTAIGLLTALLPDNADPVSMYEADKQVMWVCGDRAILSRTLDGQYPDLMRLVPQQFAVSIRADRRALLECIQRVVPVTKGSAVKWTINSDPEPLLSLDASGPEIGEAHDAMPVEVEAMDEPLVISFNARYMIEGLKSMSEDEVTLQFSGARNPARILDGGDESCQYVTLPLITC